VKERSADIKLVNKPGHQKKQKWNFHTKGERGGGREGPRRKKGRKKLFKPAVEGEGGKEESRGRVGQKGIGAGGRREKPKSQKKR